MVEQMKGVAGVKAAFGSSCMLPNHHACYPHQVVIVIYDRVAGVTSKKKKRWKEVKIHAENESVKNCLSRFTICVERLKHLLVTRQLDSIATRLKQVLIKFLFSLWNNVAVKFLTFRDKPMRGDVELDSFISTVVFLLFMLSSWPVVFQIGAVCLKNLGIFWMPVTVYISVYTYLQIMRLFYGDR